MAAIIFSFKVISTTSRASVKAGVFQLSYASLCWTLLVNQKKTFCGGVCANCEKFSSIEVYNEITRTKSEHFELSPVTEPETQVPFVILTSVLRKIILASSNSDFLTTN